MLTEEQVTKATVEFLESIGFLVLAVHYPNASGGVRLRPEGKLHKNKKSLVPDILAEKDGNFLWVESKDRFFLPDILKMREVADEGAYFTSLSEIVGQCVSISNCKFSFAMPNDKHQLLAAAAHLSRIDALITVGEDWAVESPYLEELFCN